jgi:hypothetical protein
MAPINRVSSLEGLDVRERISHPFFSLNEPRDLAWAGSFSDSYTTQPLQGAGAVPTLASHLEIPAIFYFWSEFVHKPSQAMLRRYAIDSRGIIHFIEAVVAPGRFLANRLTHEGSPLDSTLLTFKDLKGMVLHNELRSSRALAAVNFHRSNPNER